MAPITWTHREQTAKDWTIGQAVKAAAARLGDRVPMCMDAIGHNASLADKITLARLNELADKLVDDSLYYAGL